MDTKTILGCGMALAATLLAGGCATSGEREIAAGYAPVYSPDGRKIAFEYEDGFHRKIAIYDRSSGKIAHPDLGAGTICHPAFGPKGELYYVCNSQTNTGYALYKGRVKNPNGLNVFCWDGKTTRRLTSGLWHDMTPAVSPDGKKLYFASTREDKRHMTNSLFELDLTKPDAKPVLAVNGSINYCSGATSPSVSPDGQTFLWAEYGGWTPPYRIRKVPVKDLPVTDPEKLKTLTEGTEFSYAPRFDSTGRYVCVTSTTNNEKWGIHIFDLLTGKRRRFADGKEGAFSPDRRHIAYEREGVIYENDWNAQEVFK